MIGVRLQSPVAKTKDSRIGPGKMTADAIQSEVMSFTDNFSGSVAQRWNEAAAYRPAPGVKDPEAPAAPQSDPYLARRAAHERKLASVSAALSIAASPNPMVAVADMITLVTLERTLLEEPATEALFGHEATANLIQEYREQEAAIWKIGERSFSEKQQTELRSLIAKWRADHPDQRYVSQIRLVDFAVAREQAVPTKTEGGNLLSLVQLDPFAGLDPAKREVQESRMLGQRAFFQLTRMPTILKWQAESFYEGFLHAPEVHDSLGAVTQVSEAADRISKTAKQLGENFGAERQAALDQFFVGVSEQREALLKDLDQGQAKLQGTLKEVRETVDATDKLAGSLTTTAQAIESVANRVMPTPGEPADDPDHNGLARYQAAVVETGAAADRLTVLAGKIDQLLDPTALDQRTAALQTAVNDAQQSAQQVIDYAFKRLLLLICAVPVLIVLAMGSYRWLTRRSRALPLVVVQAQSSP